MNFTFFQVGQYFTHRLFVWMPKRKWNLDLRCPDCRSPLSVKAPIYQKLRRVVDIDGFYYLATEAFGKW